MSALSFGKPFYLAVLVVIPAVGCQDVVHQASHACSILLVVTFVAVVVCPKPNTKLSCACRSNRLGNLSDLIACANDLLSLAIFVELHVLVFPLCAFPDLDFASAADDTDSHRREQVVSGIGVHVDASVEHCCGIFAKTAVDHGFASGVVLDEVAHVVDDTGDGDETASVFGLVLEIIPFHHGERFERNTPVEFSALLVEFLLLLLDAAFFYLVGAELLEVVGQAHLLPQPNAPLGGVVLVPFNGVPVVGGEFVVEVVISFSKSDEGGDDVVPW